MSSVHAGDWLINVEKNELKLFKKFYQKFSLSLP